MAEIKPINDLEQWKTLWEAQSAADAGLLLVFKRSPICPTSHFVESVFNRYISKLNTTGKVSIVSVDVIGARPVSQRIAADTGIRHESPQALVIGPGKKIIWNASHGDVDEEALETVLKPIIK